MRRNNSSRRDLLGAGLLWLALVAIGEAILFGFEFLPEQFSREARIIDDAFILLSILGIPVFAFVVSVVIYSAFKFRANGDSLEDGPPIKGSKKVVAAWLTITSALALAILINPGFVGLAELRADPEPDLIIEVESQRWSWNIIYPNGVESSEELVVPVDTRIRFDVTARDVLHSFWVPAFRMKIDAVPGMTTHAFVTPTKIGTFGEDPGLRVQCAELCGIGHAQMAIPVRVVSQAEFEVWLSSQATVDALSGGRG